MLEYRYINSSLLDYEKIKERLLLEMNISQWTYNYDNYCENESSCLEVLFLEEYIDRDNENTIK